MLNERKESTCIIYLKQLQNPYDFIQIYFKYLLEIDKIENNYGNYMYFKRTSYILFRDEMMSTLRWFIINSLED